MNTPAQNMPSSSSKNPMGSTSASEQHDSAKARLGERAEVVRDALRDSAHDVNEMVHDYADRAGQAAQQQWQQARWKARAAMDRTHESVREHPMTALAIAVGAGFVLAKLLSSRR